MNGELDDVLPNKWVKKNKPVLRTFEITLKDSHTGLLFRADAAFRVSEIMGKEDVHTCLQARFADLLGALDAKLFV